MASEKSNHWHISEECIKREREREREMRER